MKFPNSVVGMGCILFIVSSSFAGAINIGFHGGFSNFSGDGRFTRRIENYGFGLDSGFNAGIRIIYDTKNLPINIATAINYFPLKNEASFMDVACPHHSYFSKVTREYSTSIVSTNLGLEYKVYDAKFSPYASLNLSANYFDKVKRTETSACDLPSISHSEFYSRRLRIGAGIGIGTYIEIVEPLNFYVQINYDWLKIFGKEEYRGYEPMVKEQNLNVLILSLGILYALE